MIIAGLLLIKECLGSNICNEFKNAIDHSLYENIVEYKYKEDFSIIKVIKEDNMINIFEVMYTDGEMSEPTNNKLIENELKELLLEIISRATDCSTERIEKLNESTLNDIIAENKDTWSEEYHNFFYVDDKNKKEDQKRIVNIFLDSNARNDIIEKYLNRIVSTLEVPVVFNILNDSDLIALENTSKFFIVETESSHEVVFNHREKSRESSLLTVSVDLKKLYSLPTLNFLFEYNLKSSIIEMYSDIKDGDLYVKGFSSVIFSNSSIFNKNLRHKRIHKFISEYKNILESIEIYAPVSKINSFKDLQAIDKNFKDFLYHVSEDNSSDISIDEVIFFFNRTDSTILISVFLLFELIKEYDFTAENFEKYFKNNFFMDALHNIGVSISKKSYYKAWRVIKDIDFLEKIYKFDPNTESFTISPYHLSNFKVFLTFFLLGVIKNNRFNYKIKFTLEPLYRIYIEHPHLIDSLEDIYLKIISEGAEDYISQPENISSISNLRKFMGKKEIVLA